MVKKTRKVLPWSLLQEAIFTHIVTSAVNLFVEARAGTSKTTTAVEAAWRYLEQFPRNKVLFLAFNKAIASELEELVPSGCWAKTCHSHGFAAVKWAARPQRTQIEDRKLHGILMEQVLPQTRDSQGRKIRHPAYSMTRKLVGFGKGALASTVAELEDLAYHHGLDSPLLEAGCSTEDIREEIRKSAQFALQAMHHSKILTHIDFDDMIYLPAALGLKPLANDLVIVDEAQDLNAAQMELIRMSVKDGGKVIFVGDRHQAIYGFRGAASDAIDQMIEKFSCERLPLNQTFRCYREIVRYAQGIVPDYRAAPNAPDGEVNENVSDKDFKEKAEPGDMVLCRLRAPMVKACYTFLLEGKPARIQGRDFAKTVIAFIDTVADGATLVPDLLEKLGEYRNKQLANLAAADADDRKVEELLDRCELVEVLADGLRMTDELKARIETLCKPGNGTPQIVLSTVHSAKGLEANRVWIIAPEKLPLSFPNMKGWEREQELNLLYVAITRAKCELNFVGGECKVRPPAELAED